MTRIAYRQTSREAYDFMTGIRSDSLDGLILTEIAAAGLEGIICQKIEDRIGRSHQAVSGNLRHLVERGLVKDGGAKGKTSSGRRAIKWVLVEPPKAGQLDLPFIQERAA